MCEPSQAPSPLGSATLSGVLKDLVDEACLWICIFLLISTVYFCLFSVHICGRISACWFLLSTCVYVHAYFCSCISVCLYLKPLHRSRMSGFGGNLLDQPIYKVLLLVGLPHPAGPRAFHGILFVSICFGSVFSEAPCTTYRFSFFLILNIKFG